MKTLFESIIGSMGMGDVVVRWEKFFDMVNECANEIQDILKKENLDFDVFQGMSQVIINDTQSAFYGFTLTKILEQSDVQKIYNKVYKIFQEKEKKYDWMKMGLLKGSAKKELFDQLSVKQPINADLFFSYESESLAYSEFRLIIHFPKDQTKIAEKKMNL